METCLACFEADVGWTKANIGDKDGAEQEQDHACSPQLAPKAL